jgi:hypothetical protein
VYYKLVDKVLADLYELITPDHAGFINKTILDTRAVIEQQRREYSDALKSVHQFAKKADDLASENRALRQQIEDYKKHIGYRIPAPFPHTAPTQEMLDDDIVWTAALKGMTGMVDDILGTDTLLKSSMQRSLIESRQVIDEFIMNGDTPENPEADTNPDVKFDPSKWTPVTWNSTRWRRVIIKP